MITFDQVFIFFKKYANTVRSIFSETHHLVMIVKPFRNIAGLSDTDWCVVAPPVGWLRVQ